MHLPLYMGIFIVLLILVFSVALLFRRKKYTYAELYAEGVKNENDGYFKAALENYNNALAEVEKYKFHEKMKQQLIEKIKVLKSAIEYESH
jgi:hypothetical protein